MKQAYAYLRCSGRGQVEGDTWNRQREVVQEFAKRQRYHIAQEFRDEGVSGTLEGFDRPGWSDLIVAIKAQEINTVIVERADRLARDLMVSEVLLNDCRKHDITVLAADSGTDLTAPNDDPTRVLIRQVLGAVSQFEKSCIVQKLAAARRRVREKTGRCEGRKAYGQRPEEAALVQRIKELRRTGLKRPLPHSRIVQHLTQEGFLTRSGTQFTRQQVQRICKRNGVS